MFRRDLLLPNGDPLKTEEIARGLFVIKGAYADEPDSFSGDSLYIKPADAPPALPAAPRTDHPGAHAPR